MYRRSSRSVEERPAAVRRSRGAPRRTLALGAAALVAAGCGGDNGVQPPTTGTLVVTVTTTGTALDPDGYTVSVDATTRNVSGASVQETFGDVPVGPRTVELGDVQDNCTVAGSNPQTVTVIGGASVTATFEVVCAPPPPAIDGVKGASEWDGASQIPLFTGATLLHRSDGTRLFLGVEVEDPTFDASDQVTIRFDDAANGVLDAGEQEIWASISGFRDGHYDGASWGRTDAVAHGEAAAAADGTGRNFFELAVPLDSGDPLDFSLSPGSTVGFCVIYTRDGTSTTATTFPSGCNRVGNDLSSYATLVVGG